MSVRPRWDQLVYRPNEIADQVDDVDDLDDAAAAAALHQHALDQIRRTEMQLMNPPTDPGLRARLERDLTTWRRVAADHAGPATANHFEAGAGDRKLF
ncbi:hypothetical protein GCM10022215_23870 [Nocardioides fonticola]|uniref:Uncharacterized protein n=1 Tax=Nocardioides fonticola TaxID=450363 RepID=A0ABP7XK51_9ACTN